MSNRQSRDATELQRARGPLTAAAGRAITHRKPRDAAPQGNHGRDNTATDGLVAAAAPTSEKELAPVTVRSGIINSLEAVAFLRKTAAAAAAAATAKPAHEAASRIACS